MIIDFKGIRAKMTMTQQEMAVALGVHLSTYMNWESGRCGPTRQNAKRVLTYFRRHKIDV